MANLLIVAGQVAVLFVLIGVGALFRRAKFLTDAAVDGLVNLLILIVTPCLIVDSFQRPFDPHMLGSLSIAFLIACTAHFAVIALAKLCVRHPSEDTRRPLVLAAVFSNAGFMGLPLQQAILGDTGVFYGTVYVVVFNLFFWSWGVKTMGREEGGMSAWKMVFNPGTVGIALGLPLFLCSVRLPSILATPVHHLANLNTPLAMIVIGYSLAGAHLGSAVRLPMAYGATFIRLLAYPLLLVAALFPFRLHLDSGMLLALTIAASAPVAAMVSMFSVKYHRDNETAVAVVCGSTLLSILTMPVVIALAMHVFS